MSRTPRRELATSNATRTRPHTASADTRHCYAQRHADAGTPVDVLRELMGHRSIATTRATTGSPRPGCAEPWIPLRAQQFNGTRRPRVEPGAGVAGKRTPRLAVGQVAVPFGICTEPSNVQGRRRRLPVPVPLPGLRPLPHRPLVPARAAGLPRHLLRDRERIRAATELDDWARAEAMPSDAEITRLRQLIRRVEHDLDALDDNDRRQIEEAVRVVRATRQTVHLGLPTTRSPALDPNLEGQP